MAPRLLIATVSAGAGHDRAANALKRAFELGGYPGEARTVDMLQRCPWLVRGPGLRAYYSLLKRFPFAWRLIYARANKGTAGGRGRRLMALVDRTLGRRFLRDVRDNPPSHVICTHWAPAETLAWMRRTGRLAAPVAVVVTDYDDHSVWVNPGTDHYFVASEHIRRRLADRGAPPDRITAPGIPIDPGFAADLPQESARRELGLDADRLTVLAMGGGGGLGPLRNTVETLAGCGDLQILAVAGHNERVRKQLDEIDLPPAARLVTYGYVDFIDKLMAAADLAVMKPGGLTSSECLAVGLPMLLTKPIPGQEEGNLDFLVECGAALPARDPDELRDALGQLLADRARLDRMSAAARDAGRPDAARDIIDATLRIRPDRH